MTNEVEQNKPSGRWTVSGRKLVIGLLVWSVILAGSIAGYAYVFAPQLKAAGDLASAEIAVFSIEGMHCAGCAESIETELAKTEGVVSVDADFETKEAVVRYVPRTTTRLRLREVVGELGFTATTKEFRKK